MFNAILKLYVYLMCTKFSSPKNQKILDSYFQGGQKTTKIPKNLKNSNLVDFLRFLKNFKRNGKVHEKKMVVTIYTFIISQQSIGFFSN